MTSYFSLIISFIFGCLVTLLVVKLLNYLSIHNRKKDIILKFQQINHNIKSGLSKYKTRIKNTVMIETTLTDIGTVSVIFFMDKNEISVFKQDKCLFSSTEFLEKKITQEIVNSINSKYIKQINDVIEVMGVTLSREDFEKSLNNQIQYIKKHLQENINITEFQENQDFESKFNVDEILDKINKTGIESLSKQELEFLNKFK